MTSELRERTRDAIRVELARQAVDFLALRGFDTVTVDELAREIGISRATFFRYFGTKEDVIVVAVQAPGMVYADALRSMSLAPGEPVWRLLRGAFEPAVNTAEQAPDSLRARMQMITALPSIRARIAEKRAQQIDEVTAALAERIGDAAAARALTLAAYAAVDLAWARWAGDEDASFRAELDAVFDALSAAHTVLPASAA